MTKFLCGECIHNSDKGGGCLIPKNLGYVDNCNRYLPKEKPIVQTNEEYIHSLNTEQLAEWLSEKLDYCQIMWYWACDKCTWSKKHESCMNDKEKWMEWLKQPHTEE